jgi:hypothetical protein
LKVMDMDRDENAMDDFSTLTFREPWLLQNISTPTASTWLSRKGIAYSKVVEISGKRPSRQGFPKDHYEEKES